MTPQSMKISHLAFLFLMLTGLGFYLFQYVNGVNPEQMDLGRILWFAISLQFWYVIPTIILFDRTVEKNGRIAAAIFITNMWARGGIELGMVYLTKNWQIKYGIGHDIFSTILTVGILFSFGGLRPFVKKFLSICCLLYLAEFLLSVVIRRGGFNEVVEDLFQIVLLDGEVLMISTWTAVFVFISLFLVLLNDGESANQKSQTRSFQGRA